MKTLLAIDPAAEDSVSDTGWALFNYSDTEPATLVDGGVIHGGFGGFCADEDFITFLRNSPDTVVCEQYKVFNHVADPSPLLIEGVVRFLRPDTVLQRSTGYKQLASDAVMKKLGMWSTTGHHQDFRASARHGLHYFMVNKHLPTLRRLK